TADDRSRVLMIGAALKRREDPPLVRGAGRYVDDLVLPHMAFLTILRSPHASARIAGVDTTRAAKLPGVLAIFTARDLEGHVDAEPAIGFPPMARRPPRPLLARDFVRYVGEPVAAVVSVDRYVGADAAAAIEVDYEPRPAAAGRLAVPARGGGFGCKIGLYAGETLCGFAAMRLDRPVKLVLTRREDFLTTTQGRGQVNDVEAAVAHDGTVLALRCRTLS